MAEIGKKLSEKFRWKIIWEDLFIYGGGRFETPSIATSQLSTPQLTSIITPKLNTFTPYFSTITIQSNKSTQSILYKYDINFLLKNKPKIGHLNMVLVKVR